MSATLEAPAHTPVISDAMKKQYRDEGYFILKSVIPHEHLQMLRDEAQFFIDLIEKDMDAKGVETIGINHKGKRYFISLEYKKSKRLPDFIFSPLMAEICKATIGENAYLFWEQYVIKCAEKGMKFNWHQDSGYVGFPHAPYVTCWCALDDMYIENGTAYILPYSRAGTKEMLPHKHMPELNDMVGYFGEDPGDPVLVPAGSIAVFSSTTFHRSGANTTSKMRRVYLPQYSAVPIMTPDGKPKGLIDPFLIDGKIVGR